MLTNSRLTARLPDELKDVININVKRSYNKMIIGGYAAAALCLVPAIVRTIVDHCDNGLPNIIIECDLEICRYDIEERVHDLLSTRTKLPYGACYLTAAPPMKTLFHGNSSEICPAHKKAFKTDYPIVASTLAGSVMLRAGAQAILDWFAKPEVQDYYNLLCRLAIEMEQGKREIFYAPMYFTDYFFPSACILSGLALAQPINKILPRNEAGETVDANSAEDVISMLNDSRFYVIHHLAKSRERFPGGIELVDTVRAKLEREVQNGC